MRWCYLGSVKHPGHGVRGGLFWLLSQRCGVEQGAVNPVNQVISFRGGSCLCIHSAAKQVPTTSWMPVSQLHFLV